MYTIENDVVETARQNMEKAFTEYKNATTDRIGALHRYLEASGAYRTILKMRYNLK